MSLSEAFSGFISQIVSLLPTSPFAPYISQIGSIPGLAWLNWFFPVGECLTVMSSWLVAVTLFYLYSVIMRWVKMIGD